MDRSARAFWLRSPGLGEIRDAQLPEPAEGEVVVRTLFSGVSRGTETLVFRGGVPESQHAAMRAPFQEGDFPGPVKYGYLNVGVVEAGPTDLLGRTVFSLYPHQTRFVVPASAVTPVPETVPASRAVLAGTVETAVNALWDAAPLIGDRITVVGAGMVGASVAALLARFPRPGSNSSTPTRRAPTSHRPSASTSRSRRTRQATATPVVHASATEAGLARSLELLAPEGTVLELSWYGDRKVSLPLGEAFHSRRLVIRSSQVGTVSPARSARRTYADRLAIALDLLADPAFDALITGESSFEELPKTMTGLAAAESTEMCHLVRYDATVPGP